MSNATLDEIGRVRLDGRVFGVSINREHIEKLDFGPVFQLLNKYGILDPATADLENLANLQFKIVIRVEDYRVETGELVEIPEIRRYFQSLHEAWPFGLYFFNPHLETLQLLVWCHTGAKVVRNAEADITGIQVPARQLREFIHAAMMPFFSIAGRLDFPPAQVSRQINEISNLFEAETEDSQKPESEENRRQRHHAFINASLPALVEIARRSFQEEGRGSIVVIPKMPGREKGGLMFVKQSDLQAAGKNAQEVRLVEQYDPHTEFVIAIVGEPGSAPPGVSSYRIKMPEAHSAQRGSEPAEHLEP